MKAECGDSEADTVLEALLMKWWLHVDYLMHCSSTGSCSTPPTPKSDSGPALKSDRVWWYQASQNIRSRAEAIWGFPVAGQEPELSKYIAL